MSYNIIPYVNRDGLWAISDDIMAAIFLEMQEAKILEMVFYAGKVKEFKHFIRYMKHPRNVVHTVWNDERPVMLAWLNNWGRHSAQAHFLTLPIIWGTKDTAEVGKLTLNYWWSWKDPEGRPLLKVITGQTPENLRAAVRYIKSVGMNVLGIVPNAIYNAYEDRSVGCVISFIERGNYNG